MIFQGNHNDRTRELGSEEWRSVSVSVCAIYPSEAKNRTDILMHFHVSRTFNITSGGMSILIHHSKIGSFSTVEVGF